MDLLFPVVHAAALKMADLQRTARLFRDLDHFLYALHQRVALSPDMGGDHTPVFSHRLQNIGKLIRARITLRQIHNAKRYAHGAPLHGILDQRPCRVQFLLCIGCVSKSLHRDLYGACADHRGKVHRQRRLFQRLQIIPVGSRQPQLHRPKHRLVKIIHLPRPCVRLRARRQADAAVPHHRRGDPLCQLPFPERVVMPH